LSPATYNPPAETTDILSKNKNVVPILIKMPENHISATEAKLHVF
jgi:hypothetical protein